MFPSSRNSRSRKLQGKKQKKKRNSVDLRDFRETRGDAQILNCFCCNCWCNKVPSFTWNGAFSLQAPPHPQRSNLSTLTAPASSRRLRVFGTAGSSFKRFHFHVWSFFFFPSSSYRQAIARKKEDVKKVQRLPGISLSTALWFLISYCRLQRFKTIKENLIKKKFAPRGSFHNVGR